ncbi:MAG: sensor histidine kinase [Bacteroidales bacterium]|nr:sensor histidine kinase [Bacteroidales bacterium]MBO7567596.1 sensor histidine kinase [Bacteroidales bacterium]
MKNGKAHKLALVISATAFVLMSGAMVAAIYVSEGDKDKATAVTVVLLPMMVCAIGYFLLKAVLEGVTPEKKEEPKDDKQEKIDVVVQSATSNDRSKSDVNSGEGLSQIISQVNDDVAQWAMDKVNEITILRNNEKFRREYIGNVSHELKTPLTNIQGYIETLIDGGLKDEEINMKYLVRTDRNISRLISIVQDLDTISKFESGMLKVTMEDFDLVEVVGEVLEFNEKKASDKHIALKIDNSIGQPVMVHADKNRIYEVINNLVINSINYGNENGTTEVVISDIENKYLLDVRDNGIGIAEENVGRVFERFFRVDKSRSRDSGGTGLGLAIVKHIMEAHNEMITVKSKIGVGTTFSITLKKANN